MDQPSVKDIMFEALDLATEQRGAFLDNACQGDVVLRAKVVELLSAHDDAGRFMAAPTAAGLSFSDSAGAAVTEQPGALLGRYRLVRELGEGGFGKVFLAEQQTPVYRKVALKILKPGMDSQRVIARFEAEHQAMALMNHPSIAKVYDAGTTTSGRPYVVMEYVDGEPVTAYCDRQRLTVRLRLEIFERVCLAVQHAHQKGIIHRDIKPNNVLVTEVDGEPVPKVIDFGIAKAIGPAIMEKTQVTEERQLVGTPEFMSPEQASMKSEDIDTRADIYSLGVLLYELLIGVPPFDREKLRSASLLELEQIIRTEEPQRPSLRLASPDPNTSRIAEFRRSDPSRLMREVRGELDWIVMRAVEKDRARRYATAYALAMDVNRYLRDEPIDASPPSRTYRATKFIRRHRVGITAASIVIASLIGLVGFSMVFAARAETARQQADTEATNARMELAKSQAISRFLESILSGVKPAVAQGADRSLMRTILEEAIRRVDTELGDQPEVELSIRLTIGQSARALGEYAMAETQYVAALAIAEEELGADHRKAWECRAALGQIYVANSKNDDGLPLLRDSIDWYAREDGAAAVETISLRTYMANYNARAGLHEDAEKEYADLLEISDAALGANHPQTISVVHHYASLVAGIGRADEAEALYRRVLSFELSEFNDTHPRVLVTRNNLAEALARQGIDDEAFGLYCQVLDGKRAVMGEDHPSTILSQGNLARFLSDRGRYDESEPLFADALERSRRTIGVDDLRTLGLMNNFAAMYMKLERYHDAEPLFVEAIERMHGLFGPDNKYSLMLECYLAEVMLNTERVAEAEPIARDVVARAESAFPADHWTLAAMRIRLGQAELSLGMLADAEATFRAAYPPLVEHYEPGNQHIQTVVQSLVTIYERTDRPGEAEEWRQKLSSSAGHEGS